MTGLERIELVALLNLLLDETTGTDRRKVSEIIAIAIVSEEK